MNQFGIVCTPRSLPPPGEQARLGVSWTRSIVYRLDEIPALLDQIGPSGRLILLLNNENSTVRSDWSGWENALHTIASYGSRIAAVECGNELDRYWANNPNDVPPAFGAHLVNTAQPILGRAGIMSLTASVAGPKWQEWLSACIADCSPDGVAAHFYGQRPDGFMQPGWGFGELRAAIGRAYDLGGHRPVYLTEIGVKLSDAGGSNGQADYARCMVQTVAAMDAEIVPAACYFAWRDDVGTGDEQGANAFGLRGPDGQARPAWAAYQQAISAAVPVPTPDPDPTPMPAMTAREAAFRDLWSAATARPTFVEYNPDSAFARWWRQHPEAGSPVGPERVDSEGVYQAFAAAGVMQWLGGDTVGQAAVS